MNIARVSWKETIPVRHRVLWPNMPPEFCHVEGDEDAMHFGAIDSGQLICVASIYLNNTSARLRKFATLPEHQSKGIGSMVLTHAIDELKTAGVTHFWCDARESAIEFYRRVGMIPEGSRFYKEDIPYFKMTLSLG